MSLCYDTNHSVVLTTTDNRNVYVNSFPDTAYALSKVDGPEQGY
jgi:hypothetical protein